jgi:hypothetical protein
MENAGTQAAHSEPLLRWERHRYFLTETLQAREQQRRANALADRECEKQVERLSVIELKSAEADTSCSLSPLADGSSPSWPTEIVEVDPRLAGESSRTWTTGRRGLLESLRMLSDGLMVPRHLFPPRLGRTLPDFASDAGPIRPCFPRALPLARFS